MKKDFYLIEAINIVSYFNKLDAEKKNALPLKVSYAFKKAVDKMAPDVRRFEEFRDEEFKKIKDIYFTEERSYECKIPKVDEKGEPVIDSDGNQETEDGRKLKPEWEEEYTLAVQSLDEKLKEIVLEKNTYEYNGVNVAVMVENLPDDTPLQSSDIELIDTILDNSNE